MLPFCFILLLTGACLWTKSQLDEAGVADIQRNAIHLSCRLRHRRTARRARAPTDSEPATTDQRHRRNSNPEPKWPWRAEKSRTCARNIHLPQTTCTELSDMALLGIEATRKREGTLIFGPISATLFLSAQGLQSRATDSKLKLTANVTRALYGTQLIVPWARRH